MLRFDGPSGIALIRCDYASKSATDWLRIHLRFDGSTDTGEYVIEIPASACDGASADALAEFAVAVRAAWRSQPRELAFLRIGATSDEEAEIATRAVASVDAGFERLRALADESVAAIR